MCQGSASATPMTDYTKPLSKAFTREDVIDLARRLESDRAELVEALSSFCDAYQNGAEDDQHQRYEEARALLARNGG